jgi:hypothetical protein
MSDGNADVQGEPESADVSRAPQAEDPIHEGLLVPGYIFAVLVPIIGFILGVIVVSRGRRPVHGYAIMGIATMVAILIAVIVTLTEG